jgi:hypothetical protein
MNPMVSDPLGSGAVFWGHPGAVNMTRTNYTVHRSMDGGATVRHSHHPDTDLLVRSHACT